VRSPSVRAAQTNDLRAELNRRRAGEDARVSLERVHERCQNIEGHNLDQDFAAVAPQAPMGTRSQAGVPLADVGCTALANHLRTASWPPKFRPHLPEKYDGTSNPSEFLQVYVTAITATGGNTAVMATYFHVALSGPARTWLMNLAPGSIYSWEELCARFITNFASAYQQHGVKAHLHAVRQEPGETLRTFISRFTKVRGTIPRISDASIITAFHQGVRDEKMLEKLATHDVETVSTLFTLADKCARAAEGRAWHSAPQTRVDQMGGTSAVSQDDKKKKKNHSYEKPQFVAPTVAAVTRGWGERNKRPRPQGGNNGSCPVHPNARHSASECRDIIKLAKRISERREQSSKDGSPPVVDLVRRGLTMMKWPRENENSGINHPRGTSRTSSLEVPTPGRTATAARSCTSCTAGAGNSPPAGTSSPYAVRSCRQLQGSRRLPHINDRGAPPAPSGHPTSPTTWQGPAYCHSSLPLSSPICDCTMC
jgi:hypothetical protein